MKEQLTKEQFLAGHPFHLFRYVKRSDTYRFERSQTEGSAGFISQWTKNTNWEFLCIVEEIHEDGFVWYKNILLTEIKDKVKFATCVTAHRKEQQP